MASKSDVSKRQSIWGYNNVRSPFCRASVCGDFDPWIFHCGGSYNINRFSSAPDWKKDIHLQRTFPVVDVSNSHRPFIKLPPLLLNLLIYINSIFLLHFFSWLISVIYSIIIQYYQCSIITFEKKPTVKMKNNKKSKFNI